MEQSRLMKVSSRISIEKKKICVYISTSIYVCNNIILSVRLAKYISQNGSCKIISKNVCTYTFSEKIPFAQPLEFEVSLTPLSEFQLQNHTILPEFVRSPVADPWVPNTSNRVPQIPKTRPRILLWWPIRSRGGLQQYQLFFTGSRGMNLFYILILFFSVDGGDFYFHHYVRFSALNRPHRSRQGPRAHLCVIRIKWLAPTDKVFVLFLFS